MSHDQPLILAHAFGARYDLPIPLWLFVAGGAIVVVLSFLVAERRDVEPAPYQTSDDVSYVRPLGTGELVGGTISLLVLAFLLYCGIAGSQEVPENIVPTSMWIVAWILVPLTCGILGDWTQWVNPFAFVAKLADRAGVRRALLGSERTVGWPDRLGWWPAAVLYFLAACGELIVNKWAVQPRVTAVALLIYLVVSAFCGLLFGRAWLSGGEMFSVLYATWGRLGFFRFGAAGRAGFAGGLDVPFAATASRTGFVLLLLVSVNFDGLLATPHWSRFTANLSLTDTLGNPLSAAKGHQLEWLAAGAFVALILVVYAVFGLFALAAARAAGSGATFVRSLADLLPSMLPIAFGYLLAHNLQYVMINSQLLAPLIGNPTGLESWPVHLPYPFNDSYEVNHNVLPNKAFWYISVAVIVLVHVAAVVIAHRHITLRSRARSAARRGEYAWLVAMVAYTMLSLWLIAQSLTDSAARNQTESTPASLPAAVVSVQS